MEINKKTKLNMETIEVKGNIFDALINLSSFDKNYISSASEEAAAQGFASNQEYHVFRVKTLMAEGFFVEEHEIVDAFCDYLRCLRNSDGVCPNWFLNRREK